MKFHGKRKVCPSCSGTGRQVKWGEYQSCALCEGYGWFYELNLREAKKYGSFMRLPPRAKKRFDD